MTGGHGFLRAQLHYAQQVLKSAWNDLYFSAHTWAIVKAREAAWRAVAALLRASGLNPSSRWPLGLLLESASPACEQLEGLAGEALKLDYLATLYTDPELYLVLWYSGGGEAATRAAAISSLEAALKIVEASGSCKSPGRAVDARGRIASRLYNVKYPGRHTVFLSGTKLYVASTHFEGVEPPERIEGAAESLPSGLTPVLLTPDEAYALLNLPWPLEEEAEIIRDELGLTPVIKKRSP